MRWLHSIGAFAFGFVGSVVWFLPVLVLFALAQTNVFWFAVLVAFTIFWWIAWTVVGEKAGLYRYGDGGLLIPYSVGGALGLIFALYNQAAINALFGV